MQILLFINFHKTPYQPILLEWALGTIFTIFTIRIQMLNFSLLAAYYEFIATFAITLKH